MKSILLTSEFENRLLKAHGDEFQRLFSQVMREVTPLFRTVKATPYKGDGGNDGWIPEEGAFYQLYGPDPTSNSTSATNTALKKLNDDFAKLQELWGKTVSIRKYFFVFNSKIAVDASLQKAMAELQKNNNLEEAKVIGTEDIKLLFFNLSDLSQQNILGGLCDVSHDNESYIGPLSVILRELAQKNHDVMQFFSQQHPDFSEKTKFNGLSCEIQSRLEYHSHFVVDVDNILARSPADSQLAALQLKMFFDEIKEGHPGTPTPTPDQVYYDLRERIIPDCLKENGNTCLTNHRFAAEIIIAKYFESCDIYESPRSVDPA